MREGKGEKEHYGRVKTKVTEALGIEDRGGGREEEGEEEQYGKLKTKVAESESCVKLTQG